MSPSQTFPRSAAGAADASARRLRAAWIRVLTLCALTLGTLLGLALPASAAASLHVTPSTVTAGRTVTVTGSCEANSVGWVISRAFFRDPTHEFAGVGAVSFTTTPAGTFSTHPVIAATTTPGRYDITARCGGGNLGVEVFVTVTAATTGTPPSAVPAGTGGLAATADQAPTGAVILGGAGLLTVAAGAVMLRRRAAAGGHR